MDRTAIRRDRWRWLATLLILTLLAGSAAASPRHEVARRRALLAAIEQGDRIAADCIVAEALEREPTSDDSYWELRVLRGLTLFLNGWTKEAIASEEFKLPDELAGSATDIRRLLFLAVARHFNHDPRAAELLASVRRSAKKNPEVQGDVYTWLAIVEANRNQFALAEQDARIALEAARRNGETWNEISAMNQIAFNCAKQAHYPEAVHWWEQVTASARARKLDFWIQKAAGNLGWVYLELGDYEQAASYFEPAEQLAAQLQAPDVVKWTNQRGNVALQLRDYEAAARYCGQAVRLCHWKTTEEALGHALANLARVAIETNDARTAQCRNDTALALKFAGGDEEGVLRSRILNAEIALLRGENEESLKILEEIAKQTANHATERSIEWEARGRMAIVLRRMHRDGDAEKQFRRATENVREARESIHDSDLGLAFFRVAEDIFDAYIDFLTERGRVLDALEVTERIRAQSLEKGLGVVATKPVADPRTLAREHNATILSYWLGRAKSYAWVITPTSVALKTLPPDRVIAKLVDEYRAAILDPRARPEDMSAMGEQLFTMLVAPAAIPPNTRVIVIPDGRLHVLNLESLIEPRAGTRFWIQDVTIINASSLQLLAHPPQLQSHGDAMLLVGNPPTADPSYPQLPNAKIEMEKVQSHFRNRVVLEGPLATPARFGASAPGKFDYIHFVAHGESTGRKPLDAAVILGRDPNGAYKLMARNIFDQKLGARLVTVSSCHGAGTRAFVGEGLVGLAWAFQRAGARQVIAALWEVDDVATPRLMDEMYARITTAGDDPATALRRAKLDLMSRGVYRKPFYWAPFVLYGV